MTEEGKILAASHIPWDFLLSSSALVAVFAGPYYCIAANTVSMKYVRELVFRQTTAATSIRERLARICAWQKAVFHVWRLFIVGLSVKFTQLDYSLRMELLEIGRPRRGEEPLQAGRVFLQILACGIAIESLLCALPFLRRCSAENSYEQPQQVDNSPSSPSVATATTSGRWLVNRRFSCFLLFLGCSFLQYGTKGIKTNQYEYVGPMRMTRLPSLWVSDDWFAAYDALKYFPCLDNAEGQALVVAEKSAYSWQYNFTTVRATLEIGWGHEWGCRDASHKERWNTNWPRFDSCATMICKESLPDA